MQAQIGERVRFRPWTGVRDPEALIALLAALVLTACGAPPEIDFSGPTADWPFWGGDRGATHFSPLTQIHLGNVDQLEVAWVHRSGDYYTGTTSLTSFAVTPIVVHDTLYYCTPFQRVFALDPESGEERWSFDPGLVSKTGEGPYPLNCRGVSYWEDSRAAPGTPCARRIFHGTRDSELIALDADTGEPCANFGVRGRVALREGLDPGSPAWEYYPTAPPQVMRDKVVLGALVADNVRVDAPSGVVRAFDARTGELVWAWDPVPPDWTGEVDPQTGRRYAPGTPNVWSIITGDAERGLVFVPTGNPAPDLYGGSREGIDHFGSSTVALDVESGEVVWSFQSVHHDVWDYDAPSPPTLFQLPGVGGGRPAVAQTTKMGFIFLLDRESGEPLYAVEERPVPQGGVAGETLSPTQPFPTHPPPLHPLDFRPEEAFGFTPIDRAYCRELIESYRWEGIYTPPSLQGSIQSPHTAGGMNWGGVSIDPNTQTLFTNQIHMALVTQLVPREEVTQADAEAVYPNEFYEMRGVPYAVKRHALMSNFGAPCNPPPWGTLKAVDLVSGEVLWDVPLGTTRELAPYPLWFKMGVPNFGGSLATASGLVFIGAATDRYFRAFDAATGELAWRVRIPVNANTVPMSYRLREDSRQFVVVAAGGNPLGEVSDRLTAYALPLE